MPDFKLGPDGFPIQSAPAPTLGPDGFPVASAAPASLGPDGFPSEAPVALKPPTGDDAILQARADRKAAVVAEKAATLAGNNQALLESQGVFLPDPNEPVTSITPEAVAPGTPHPRGFLEKIGDADIRGKIGKFLSAKVEEHKAATAAQQQQMGKGGQFAYTASNPLLAGLSPEHVVETGKVLAQKAQGLYQGFRPNDAKRNALWAEGKMKDMLDALGDNEPTEAEQREFADTMARAKQMWDLSEVERDKRQKAVQSFEERSSKWVAPGTPGAKFIGQALPMAAQVMAAPQTIPALMAAETVARKNLNNPTQYQTLGRQLKQGAFGYGQGQLMMSGFPGIPVAGVLKAAGINPVAADVAGMATSAGVNTYSSYLNDKNLTAPMPQEDTRVVKDETGAVVPGAYKPTLPEAPGLEQYLQDFATQAAFHMKDKALGRLGPVTAAPAPGAPGEVIPIAQQLRSLVAPHGPNARLSEHESGAAQLKGKALADRLAMDRDIQESMAIAPEHHATADAILEAQSVVAKADAIKQRLDAKIAAGEELTPYEEGQLKTSIDPAHPLRALAETDVTTLSPEAQRLIELTKAHQAENAQEFNHATGLAAAKAAKEAAAKEAAAASAKADAAVRVAAANLAAAQNSGNKRAVRAANKIMGKADKLAAKLTAKAAEADADAAAPMSGEGVDTHLPRVLQLQAGATVTPVERLLEFAGIGTTPAEGNAPSTGKRPKQTTEYKIQRRFEVVETPTGPEVVLKGEPGSNKLKVFGDPDGRTIEEADVISRREATKAEIEDASPRSAVTGKEEEPSLTFAKNPVAAVVQARLANRSTARGREVLEGLVKNPSMAQKGSVPSDGNRQEWKSVDDLNITDGAKQRIKEIVTGRKGEWAQDVSIRPDVAQTLLTYFGKPVGNENTLLGRLSQMSRNIVERGLLTNPFAHFTNQFTHGIGALTAEGFKGQEAARAINQSYEEGGNPQSAYVAEARAAGVKQMNEGRQYGSGRSAAELATGNLEQALGHAPETLGHNEGGVVKNNIKALNQDMVWRVDDAIRNALYYRAKANFMAEGMTPQQASIKAADHANTHYPGYETKTNLIELNPNNAPNSAKELAKKAANMVYRGLVTGKGDANNPALDLVRTATSPLFHTFRINSAQVLGRELAGAAKADPKALAKLGAMGAVGMAYKGALGQQLSDTFLNDEEKRQGKEYRGRVGGPFHFADTALDLAQGETTPRSAFFRMAMPSPVAKLGWSLAAGQDLPTGRQLPPFGGEQLADTLVSAVAGGGDTGRPSLMAADRTSQRDAAVALMGGANIPHPGLKVMLSNIAKTNQPRDYVAAKQQRVLMSKFQSIAGDPELVDETMKAAARDESLQAALKAGDMTINDIKNAAIRGNQTELEHARAIAKIATPEAVVKAAEMYAEENPRIARVLYGDAIKKYAKALKGTPFGSTNYKSKMQVISNKMMTLPED